MAGAPALFRGIEVLRILSDGKPQLFSQIADVAAIPKASLTRILRTLRLSGVVRRDPKSRAFLATSRLVPLSENRLPIETLVVDTLASLANISGHTAEWYIPAANSLVLSQRQEPRNAEVSIRANIGFTRSLDGELEAVSTLGNAFFRTSAPTRAWTYVKNGTTGPLSRSETQKRIAEAKMTGSVADLHCNSNGIRRLASVVHSSDGPIGVLALAEFVPPSCATNPAQLLATLTKHAFILSGQLLAGT